MRKMIPAAARTSRASAGARAARCAAFTTAPVAAGNTEKTSESGVPTTVAAGPPPQGGSSYTNEGTQELGEGHDTEMRAGRRTEDREAVARYSRNPWDTWHGAAL